MAIITLDTQSRLPIYEQLKRKIIELIMLEIFLPDEQLPSVRNLARELGVNPNTVQKAYQELEHEGIIYSQGGRGSFVNPSHSSSLRLQERLLKQLEALLRECADAGISLERVQQQLAHVFLERSAES